MAALPVLVTVYLLIVGGTLLNIRDNSDRINNNHLRIQLHIAAAVFLCFGVTSLLFILLNGYSNQLGAYSLFTGIVGAIMTSWDRENRIYNVQEDEIKIKKYRFVLPRGVYSELLDDWVKFVINPFTYVVEIHKLNGSSSKPRKYCFKVEENTPTNKIHDDPNILHGCRECRNAEEQFVQFIQCWNNPMEHKVKESDLCLSCYIQLMEKVEEEISGFESPNGKILATNI